MRSRIRHHVELRLQRRANGSSIEDNDHAAPLPSPRDARSRKRRSQVHGRNRRRTSAACACAGRSSSESSEGSASVTPAPRKRPRREMERAIVHLILSSSRTAPPDETKRFGRTRSLNQAANARGLDSLSARCPGRLEVRFVAGRHGPAETVGEQLRARQAPKRDRSKRPERVHRALRRSNPSGWPSEGGTATDTSMGVPSG